MWLKEKEGEASVQGRRGVGSMGSNGRQGTQSGGEYGRKRMEEDEMKEWRKEKDKKE